MFREAYAPSSGTNKPKINGVTALWEAPPTGGRGGWRHGTREDTYAEESEIGYDLRGDVVVLGFWGPRLMCVFDINFVDTAEASYDGRHPQKILFQNERHKKG